MSKQILLPTYVKRELMQTFKVTRLEVWRALTYEVNSKTALMIRTAALQRGGLVYTGEPAPEGFIPNVDTVFDHVNGLIRQTLGNDIKLTLDRKDSSIAVFYKDKQLNKFKNVTGAGWSNILYSLHLIYNQLNS